LWLIVDSFTDLPEHLIQNKNHGHPTCGFLNLD
jgi:hypothetical protein